MNGGSVELNSTGPVTLGSGSLVNTSSGAAILASGSPVTSASGGDITLISGTASNDGLTLGGTLQSIGVAKGGALTLAAPSIIIGTPQQPPAPGQLVLAPSFFQQGFSAYNITGYGSLTDSTGMALPGVEVTPGTDVEVVEPVFEYTNSTPMAPTGTPIASALQEVLFPVYLANPVTGTVTQRAGASIALSSVVNGSVPLSDQTPIAPFDQIGIAGDEIATGGGSVIIGAGATIRVDPAQSILVQGFDQVTVNGTLAAPSGSITVANIATADTFVLGQSVFIGNSAVLDAAAQPFVAQDVEGRPFGVVPAGGTITLGTELDDRTAIYRSRRIPSSRSQPRRS